MNAAIEHAEDSAKPCANNGINTTVYPESVGLRPRADAALTDFLIVFAPFAWLGALLVFLVPSYPEAVAYFFILLLAIPCLVYIIYKPCMEAFLGGTLGKSLHVLQVTDARGDKLSLEAAYVSSGPLIFLVIIVMVVTIMGILSMHFFRTDFSSDQIQPPTDTLYLPSYFGALQTIVVLFVIVDCLAISRTRRNRALHDMMAESYCVHNDSFEGKGRLARFLSVFDGA